MTKPLVYKKIISWYAYSDNDNTHFKQKQARLMVLLEANSDKINITIIWYLDKPFSNWLKQNTHNICNVNRRERIIKGKLIIAIMIIMIMNNNNNDTTTTTNTNNNDNNSNDSSNNQYWYSNNKTN